MAKKDGMEENYLEKYRGQFYCNLSDGHFKHTITRDGKLKEYKIAKENEMEEKYIGQFYCYLRRDYFRWSEYIDFYKRLGY